MFVMFRFLLRMDGGPILWARMVLVLKRALAGQVRPEKAAWLAVLPACPQSSTVVTIY